MLDIDYGLLFNIATLVFVILLLYLFSIRARRMNRKALSFLGAFLLIGLALFMIEGVSPFMIAELELGILTFNGFLSGITPMRRNIYVSLSLLYIALIHAVGLEFVAQALLLGILSGVTYIREYKSSIVNRRLETERDVIHIGMGVLLMLIFYFESWPVAITLLLLLILLGIFVISVAEIYSKNRRLAKSIYRLERNGATLGHGALWMALGSLVAVSFLGVNNIMVVFAAMFIGDPVATIVGIHAGGKKLPYNHSKSVAGTTAYFIVTAAISYYFIGLYAIPIALIAAFVESLKLKLDDNFTVSFALTAVMLLTGV